MPALRPTVTTSPDADWCVPTALVHRLFGATENDVLALVDGLSPKQRARLAVYCYHRGHLHAIGLAIAATCDLPSLVSAAPSNGAGSGLYAQSREPSRLTARSLPGRRPITLAKSASGHKGLARMIAVANGEPELEPLAGTSGLAPDSELR
jgi:hypothetical protein